MKILLTLLTALALVISVQAQNSVAYPVTANVSSNLLSSGRVIDNLTLTATTTNITTFRFYDTSNTTTSIVRAAYVSLGSYSTNWSNVFTNEAGIILTNTFSGIYTYPTSVSAVTNSRPVTITLVVPGSSVRSRDTRILTLHGLAVVPDQDGVVEVTYH